ncbi:hypothetical protein Y032_0019g3941 [Ancylostoma ceylanicum]|uniref:protein-tyrosine-phosphatase n=2 Tax=Ancylostoma ceylanicum TaxID=53326 RepID=A0A016V1W7_9BILA|nr:hypothetical protein Y032_0019g3941 [Ancylostoma ceylanicum]
MDTCFNLLNQQFPHIQFTREKPRDNWLAFLNVQVYLAQGEYKTRCKNKKTLDEESPITRRRPPVRLLSFSVISDEEKENSILFPNFDTLNCASSSVMTGSVSISSFSECCESDIVWTPPKAKVDCERATSAERVSTKKIVRKRITESVLSDSCIEKKRSCAIRSEFFQSNVSLVEDDVFEPDDFSPNVSCASEHSSVSCSLSRSFLRTQSTGQLECQQKSPLLSPEVDYSLPGVEHPQRESLAFRSISAATLASEIRRLGPEAFERRYVLIDCRYPYEYEGGHVKCAVNIHDQNELEKLFFPDDPNDPIRSRIPIFYCEFSQKRGPGMALALRSIDRTRNELNYPKVDYAEMYLLDQGYRKFWNDGCYKAECVPCGYVPMTDSAYVSSLVKYKWHKSKSMSQLVVRERERIPLRKTASMFRYRSLMQVCCEVDTNDTNDEFSSISPTAKTPDLLPRRLEFTDSPDCRKAE